jgi:hypothetical protein
VAVWLYPNDPDLPGLARAAYADKMALVLNEYRVLGHEIGPSGVRLRMIGYRPRRRAVLRVDAAGQVLYCKVLRERLFADVIKRHQLLLQAGVPAPAIAATTGDCLLLLRSLPGRPLAKALFDPGDPCRAEDLIRVLDAMPMSVTQLERRPPWPEAVDHYAQMVALAMPSLEPKLDWLVGHISSGLAHIPSGNEPTHGDFHEGQVHVLEGRIVGILDVDTVGPGRRADDLACLIAHLSTIQRMNPAQEARVHQLIREWVPVFDARVDPTELRLRAAAVIISLATGPFRAQEPHWERETVQMVASAEALVRQVR